MSILLSALAIAALLATVICLGWALLADLLHFKRVPTFVRWGEIAAILWFIFYMVRTMWMSV